jgi:hypothetical protein
MTELRWLLSRTQMAGAFSEPIPWPDGSTVYARLQYRVVGLVRDVPWKEIPIASEIVDRPRIALVPELSRDRH